MAVGSDGSGLRAALARYGKLHGVTVTAGIQSAEPAEDGGPLNLVQIAAVNEFGSADGKIPSRPFMRTAFATNRQKWAGRAGVIVRKMREGADVTVGFQRLGLVMAADVRDSLNNGTWTSNASSTIRQKRGGDQPLVNTGQLRNSIRAAVTVPGSSPEVVG